MGKTRGNRGGKARKQRQQEKGGAQKVAALEQVEQGEINKGGIEGTVLEGNQEQGGQHMAAFGSTGGGVATPILPQLTGQGGDEEGEGKQQVESKQGKQGQS